MLNSRQFFPKVAAVLLRANKADCRSTFAFIVTKEHGKYLVDHQKELREFYRTQYQMSDGEFDKLFKLEQLGVTPDHTFVPNEEDASREFAFK